jgi:hypothetical protein
MIVPSRLQSAMSAFVLLALVPVLPCRAAAQSTTAASAGAASSAGESQLSAVPVTAPVAIGTSTPVEGASDNSGSTPAPQLDADPIPRSAGPAVTGGETEIGPTGSGPTSSAATAGIRSQTATNLTRQQLADRAAAANHSALGTDGVLMIVGGAGFIAGLIIGGGAGTAIAIAGAVIALYGLYLYLR